jgi:hypothetical protein
VESNTCRKLNVDTFAGQRNILSKLGGHKKMPNYTWSKLSPLQLGKYAEYYTKMEFTSYGFEVYTSEVDDHGVDFVAKAPNTSKYYEVQVKSCRKTSYVFEPKDKMPLAENRLMCLLHFVDDQPPTVYIIPTLEWQNPNGVLVDREYDPQQHKSKPEWGINVSQKNLPYLERYQADNFFKQF